MLSPLHPALRLWRRRRKKMTIPLNYRVVLAAVWLVSVGSWLALRVWPAELGEQGRQNATVTVIEQVTPSPTLVSETSLVLEDRELTHHE